MAGKRDMTVTVEADQETPPTLEGAAKWYWYGVCGSIPYQDVTVAGIQFMRWTAKAEEDDSGGGHFRLGSKRLGHVTPLDAETVEAIHKRVADLVVVWPARIGKGKAFIRSLSDKKYRRVPGNEKPMGNYLYLQEVAGPHTFDRSKEPAPIAQ